MFHRQCGDGINLINNNCTAVRNCGDPEKRHVVSLEPLKDDQLFEIRIDKKFTSWGDLIEIGITTNDPDTRRESPGQTWMLTSTGILKNGQSITEINYATNLDNLEEGNTVGVMKTSNSELVFYINGLSQGVAATNIPTKVFALIELYHECVQITITNPTRSLVASSSSSSSSPKVTTPEINNDHPLGESSSTTTSTSMIANLNVNLNVNMNVSLPKNPTPQAIREDRLRFHERVGALVKLSNNARTAERRRPLDEFNNGVVMTHRHLRDNELFEIRIDRLVDKWSGSIEVGVTTHSPTALEFPATMTNMRSGTTMMSGCGILTNGKGIQREYGEINLDELREGDRVGMIRHSNGNLHYLINGLDQGIAAKIPHGVWGVVELYGMTVKVTIVDRDEREEQNLITRRNTLHLQGLNGDTIDDEPLDRLTFHPCCGTHADVINNGRTAHRPNAMDDFNNGVVLTMRPLRCNELFEVKLDKIVTKWAGSIEIGVTTHSPTELEFPFTMTNVRSGTWIMTGNGVMHNGNSIIEQYGQNLDRLQVGDRVGVMRKDNGTLHFFVNGIDQGVAAVNVPERIYGVIDLYGQATQATIIDYSDYYSPTTNNSSFSNTTLYSDLRFHHVHGKHARISNNGLTASRIRALGEFNEAIVIANRPLRDGELFQVSIDKMVGRWSGAIEAGVTAIRPDELEFPSTMTDIDHDTWMLSGSTVMRDGVTLRHHYACDLDKLTEGNRIGMMRCTDATLHYYLDGQDQGVACTGLPAHVYPVIDLYAQCAQVTIVQPERRDTMTQQYLASENSLSQQPTSVIQPQVQAEITHKFHESVGLNIQLNSDRVIAARCREYNHAVLLSECPLETNELFEISIQEIAPEWCGSLQIGVISNETGTWLSSMDLVPGMTSIPADAWYLTGNEIRHKNYVLSPNYCPSLDWLRVNDKIGLKRSHEGHLKFYINGEDMGIAATNIPELIYAIVELFGTTVAVKITSTKQQNLIMSLNASLRLQDSLELVLDSVPLTLRNDPGMDDTSVELSELKLQENSITPCQISITNDNIDSTDIINYEFHENHGRNIELEGKRVAKRVASYNQGVVMSSKPLVKGKIFKIKIDKINDRWVSGILCGVTCLSPDKATFPLTALGFKKNSWIICSDWMSHNGVKIKTRYGENLDNIKMGSTIGLLIDEESKLHLIINGIDQGIAVSDLPQFVYGVIDLYGQVEKISIIGTPIDSVFRNNDAINHAIANDNNNNNNNNTNNNNNDDDNNDINFVDDPDNSREKADLECYEKENINGNPSNEQIKINNDDDVPINACIPSDSSGNSTTTTNININNTNNILNNFSKTLSCQSIDNNSDDESDIENDLQNTEIKKQKYCKSIDLNFDNNTISNDIGGSGSGGGGGGCGSRGGSGSGENINYDIDNNDDDIDIDIDVDIDIDNDNVDNATNEIIGLNNDCTNVDINNATNINIKNGSAASSSNMSNLNTAINSTNANNAINESIASNSQMNNSNIIQDNLITSQTDNIINNIIINNVATNSSGDSQNTNFTSSRINQMIKSNDSDNITGQNQHNNHHERILTSPNIAINNRTVIVTSAKKCEYLKACLRLKKSLVLPDEFFLLDDVTCYCSTCYKINGDEVVCEKGEPPAEFRIPVGWVRFPLKMSINANQIPQSTIDKWHVAFYGTRLDSIRWILDMGELLTVEQLDMSNLTTIINSDDQNLQVIFSPNINHVTSKECSKKYPYIDTQSNRKLNASTAFQLLVRPGSYTMSLGKESDDGIEPTEWATKEAGATVIIALLIHLDGF